MKYLFTSFVLELDLRSSAIKKRLKTSEASEKSNNLQQNDIQYNYKKYFKKYFKIFLTIL